jgi:phosphatidylserine/phosphatidylglycerophosphate/cardiolipin synthase-like enzyme
VSPDTLEVHPLHPGGQTALDVARRVEAFVAPAQRTLDLALYDLRLPGEAGDLVAAMLSGAAERGVVVRIAYNADHDERIFPPPPRTEPELLQALPFPSRGVPGRPDLMHHKYVVRDGEAVWTGSANWTSDSWTLQENVILTAHSPRLAAAFGANFQELWDFLDVDHSAHVEEPQTIGVGGRPVRAWFTPGQGPALSHRIARAIGRAHRRVRIASPVVTAGPVLGTLAQVTAEASIDVRGVIDRTQMDQVIGQWRSNERSAWKIPIFGSVMQHAEFAGKPSTPWAHNTPHDFMHAKVTVVDDTVFAGSFNLSRSGEQNAENVLEIEDAELAEQLATFIDTVRARYPRVPPPAWDGPAPGSGAVVG